MEWLLFKIRNADDNTQKSINVRRQSAWQHSWMTFENLPAGNYEVYVQEQYDSTQHQGVLDFGLAALGSKQAPVWEI